MDNKYDQDCLFLYGTCPDMDTAKAIARSLLEARLVACVNLMPEMVSLFRWDGALQEEGEVAFIAKTTKSQMKAAMDLFKTQHPYEEPAIVALPITDGLSSFLKWVAMETAGAGSEAPSSASS